MSDDVKRKSADFCRYDETVLNLSRVMQCLFLDAFLIVFHIAHVIYGSMMCRKALFEFDLFFSSSYFLRECYANLHALTI